MKEPSSSDEMSRDKHLRNLEVVTKILESGTPEEMEELREVHKLSKEKMDFMRYYARLRRKTLDEMYKAQAKRKQENPVATEDELSLGCYVEYIEPQVRDAVLGLRRKGYKTEASGFHDFGTQDIQIDSEQMKDFIFPENLRQKLEQEKPIEIKAWEHGILLEHKSEMGLDEIKEIWDEIEKALPDLGKPAEPSQIGVSDSFREKQAKLKK